MVFDPTTTLDLPACTSAYLNSGNELGMNKGFDFDSLSGLHLTPTRTVTDL